MRVRVLIRGVVQGVGFRAFVARLARRFGIKGYVRNMPTGEVEAVFDGEESKVRLMIEFCKRGPPLARVEGIEVEEIDEDERFLGFEIRR